MGPQINFSGQHVTVSSEEIQPKAGVFALIADISESVSIPPGAFKVIPLPTQAKGDGQSMIVMTVEAGKRDGDNAIRGQFHIPREDAFEQLEAVVVNHTTAALIISPKNQIGYMELVAIGTDDEDDGNVQDQDDSGFSLTVPTVYNPQHIDREGVPAYATAGAAAMDVRADIPAAIILQPGQRHGFDTGLRMAVPDGYEAQMRPRSGLAAKHGITITNSPGTIDSDYRGEIKAILQNTGDEVFTVEPGDRIAQLLIAPVVRARLDFRADLDDTARGDGGFGSTGRN